MEEYRARLGYVEGASGLAVAVGGTVVALDLFDKSSTCRKAWDRLLTGVVMDALETPSGDGMAGVSDVEDLLARLQAASWQPAPAVGEGEEYRAEAERETHASALLFGGSVLQGSAVVAG
jgi:hypothetical protein